MYKKFSEIDQEITDFKDSVEILPTGLGTLDPFLDGGFFKQELVVIGAKTGGGKSLVGGQIFKNVAQHGFKSAYFSLEISNKMLVSRLIGAQANISPTKVMVKVLNEDEAEKKNDSKATLSVYEEFMHFYDNIFNYELIEKEIIKNQYDFVVVDFIQNVIFNKPDEYERLSSVALKLQQLAKKANCCILVLSQLSNSMARDKKTNIVEYKGSGSIATVCDLGFFIEDAESPNMLILRLRKNRRGISGEPFVFQVRQPGGLLIAV
jgi:replicative DNA helicase